MEAAQIEFDKVVRELDIGPAKVSVEQSQDDYKSMDQMSAQKATDDVMDLKDGQEESSGKKSHDTPQKSSRSITSSKLFQQAKEATSQAAQMAIGKLQSAVSKQ